jgi:hypothetical protein
MSLILSGTDGLSDIDGSAATPAIRGTDANTGIFFPAADTVAATINGSEGMRLTSTGLGIGTSSPSYKLNVSGANYVFGLTGGGTSRLAQSVVNTGGYLDLGVESSAGGALFNGSSAYAACIGSANATPFQIGSNGTIRATFDTSGNLGIGVTPSAWGGSIKALEGFSTSGSWSIASGGGLGSALNIQSNAYYDGSNWIYKSTSPAANYYQSAGTHVWRIAASGTAGNAITFTQPMTLTAAGNLCIGRTSVYSTNAERLSVEATGNSPAILAINAAGATDYTYVSWNSATTGDNKFVGFFTEASPTLRGSIDYNRAGGVTRYNTSSDATLKNINGDAPKQISIDILNSTKIREYSWKDDATNKVQIGVIAQELHETFKGAVSVGGDKVTTDAEGNETTEYVPWAVDKTAFTFHLVAGWQEHERIIQEQQALIVSLKARLDAANL